MQSTQLLPSEYHTVGSFDLRNNPKALIQLNVLGFLMFAVTGWVFVGIFSLFRPQEVRYGLALGFSSLSDMIQILLAVLGMLVVMIVLHEAVHGVLFWWFTRAMPKFAFKGAYAYAAAPDWYLPKYPYLSVALGPLVVLSLAGIALMMIVPPEWFMALLFFLVTNASGAVGDLWVAVWLLRQPHDCYVNDLGDAVTLYVKG
jgi:hypothetical protein